MPPVGERWDFDDGGDRWGSGSEDDESGEMGMHSIKICHQNELKLVD